METPDKPLETMKTIVNDACEVKPLSVRIGSDVLDTILVDYLGTKSMLMFGSTNKEHKKLVDVALKRVKRVSLNSDIPRDKALEFLGRLGPNLKVLGGLYLLVDHVNDVVDDEL